MIMKYNLRHERTADAEKDRTALEPQIIRLRSLTKSNPYPSNPTHPVSQASFRGHRVFMYIPLSNRQKSNCQE